MADTPETTGESEKELNIWHRIGVFGEGFWDGTIDAVSSVGLVIDAANHAPRLLNVLPYVDGFEPFHPRPFLGSAMIHDSLTGAHDAYKDAVLSGGATMFDPVDTTDHLIYGGGYVTGVAAGAVSTGAVANSALAAAAPAVTGAAATETTVGSLIGRQFVTASGNPTLLGHGTNLLGQGALATGKYAATLPLRYPFMTAATAAYVDIAHNDARLTAHYGKEGANFVSERMGIGPVFATESNPEGFSALNLLQDPAKLAGMATVMFAMNSVLNNFLGNALGLIASLALALTFHELIGEKSNQLVTFARDAVGGLTGAQNDRTPPQAPAPGL